MAVKKIAISIPEEVLENIDKVSKKLNISRSEYISSILKVSKEAENVKTTQAVDEVFKDKALVREQKAVARHLALTTSC